MNIAHLLDRAAQHAPERTALYLGARPLRTYRQLRDRVAAIAQALGDRGCQPGDRIALFLGNRPEYLELVLAAWWAGLVVVPINVKLHPEEAAFILTDAQARLLVTDQAHADEMRAVLDGDRSGLDLLVADSQDYDQLLRTGSAATKPCASVTVTDVAWLFYTSGTTGRPKGVMLAHRQLMAMIMCYHAQVDAVGPDDRTLYAAPMSHGAGIYSGVFLLNGSGHVFPPSGGFDEAEVCDIARTLGRVSLFAAPTMVNRLVRHVERTGAPVKETGAFKTITYGGGPMYVHDLIRARQVMGDCFVQIYGQGESPMTITTLSRADIADDGHPRWLERIGSVGKPFAMCDVAVVDATGKPVPPGVTGEVVVRGDTVMLGYWRNPEATAATIRDGWLWTGDLGSLDEDGYLTLKDRSKDVIISGGSNIYPREVEEVLLRHDGVAEVSVIGRPDPEWGEAVVACVVLRDPSVDADELDSFCRQHIARFKRPKEYHFLDALPKNNYGKVLKRKLREGIAK
ncbi:AMP-dependent synthetase [Carbonactinospora thermoautotrophica]|uniref:AMP-dependent synthetase n=1 Tax=Carbonactinospora thermoautotrophica TaxID=1469144 RepID=A0A132N3Y9_9ACTN|nr:AMP-binding protein [Carbonactinospora thermoautotrophica]KWX01042.1 putative long-chain-fatty-acid CoA ligase [Carbonactinospora thermoautotrophica]KWX04716.1 AMP-dependent synthetase [Carbonactinospora thermoautotrophica]KWX05206.1 AMP-dependent synthetase [Carbonactinospora thermoautotrophica]